jgi:magnesium-transporting ATPase (P-type)
MSARAVASREPALESRDRDTAMSRHPKSPHALPVHQALILLGADRTLGLRTGEAERRLLRFGPNVLPRLERRSALVRLALQFHHPLVYVLIAAAAVTVALGQFVDAGVIAGVVLANALIGFIQESRAEHALEALAAMIGSHARVVRDGRRQRISSAELVPGDLLIVEAGDIVGADVRLTEVRGLELDESALTGESTPSRKALEPLPDGTGVGDRSNMAHSGTVVTRGDGAGLVVATGADTELGRIHRLMGEVDELATPLMRKIAGFSKALTIAILALAAATYLIGILRGDEPGDLFVAAVALAVGAIPEGLPAAITITLAVGVSRMARRHAIVRRLPAVETLGSTTVICTDKTGTLTQNEMTVQVIVAGGERFELAGVGYSPEGAVSLDGLIVSADEAPALHACVLAGALCNDSRLLQNGGRWQAVGDPTEAALLVVAHKSGIDPEFVVQSHPRVAAIPFESERRYMATLHDSGEGRPAVLYCKGAVEAVLPMCTHALAPDGARSRLDAAAVHAEADLLAKQGLRVLAFARRAGTGNRNGRLSGPDLVPQDLDFIGLQAMADPPRPSAVAAVAACRRAGVAVKMITGDHPATAEAIASLVGLGDGTAQVMTGADVEACEPDELVSLARQTAVFARVSAEQKLRLVEALQRSGEIVAMTGDGVNDAPALKRADIGVGMGRSGTEVAREASDVVLTDDDFASIAAAVEEGRRIFDNLMKFIVWTLPTNLAEGLLILTAIVAGVALPVLPVQVLWINMTTAVALGLMLAFERQEPGIMDRPPRDPAQRLLTSQLVGRILLVSALLLGASFWLFELERASGASLAEARTVAVNVFVAVEIFYLLNCRSLDGSILGVGLFSNRPLLLGVATAVVLQLLFTYAGPMQTLFHSAAIEPSAWLPIIGAGLAVGGAVGAEKWLRRRRHTAPVQPRG